MRANKKKNWCIIMTAFRPVFFLLASMFFLLFIPEQSWSHHVFFDENTRIINLAENLELFEDQEGAKTLEDIMALKRPRWEVNQEETFNVGFTSSTFWIRKGLTNISDQPLRVFVDIEYPVLDHVHVFAVREETVDTWALGDKIPYAERPVDYPSFVIPMTFLPKETVLFYARVKTASSMQFPFNLYSSSAFLEKKQYSMMINGFYFGSMLIMAVYNLFLFISIRESDYFYYVLYVVFQCLFIACISGLAFKYLWPQAVIWNDQTIILSLAVMIFSGSMSAIRFLKMSTSDGFRYYTVLSFAVCALVIAGLSFFIPYRAGIILTAILTVICFLLGLPIVISRWVRGYSPGRFFSMAWFFLGAGVFILVFNKTGVITRSFVTENSMQFGSMLQVILLSFALADRLNTEKREKIEAQQLALQEERKARIANEKAILNERLTREAREEAFMLQKKAADSLELEVEENTGQLIEALAKVKEANSQVMSSLRYARMIQMSILPDMEAIRSVIPDLVTWWVPRDLVGGDFYYIEPVKEGFIVAVADCTGRGVAGAFMTIIAGSELRRIVKIEGCHDPGDILAQLNRRINKALKQDRKRSLADDGLNIGVCVVDRNSGILTFSGANIDMVYSVDGEIHTLKGDRKGVGYLSSVGYPGYLVQNLRIENKMKVYIYTDGVTDQPGERSGQRFGSRRLTDLIKEYSNLPVSVQCEIIKASTEVYRGERDQVDDMTMVAFEIKV